VNRKRSNELEYVVSDPVRVCITCVISTLKKECVPYHAVSRRKRYWSLLVFVVSHESGATACYYGDTSTPLGVIKAWWLFKNKRMLFGQLNGSPPCHCGGHPFIKSDCLWRCDATQSISHTVELQGNNFNCAVAFFFYLRTKVSSIFFTILEKIARSFSSFIVVCFVVETRPLQIISTGIEARH